MPAVCQRLDMDLIQSVRFFEYFAIVLQRFTEFEEGGSPVRLHWSMFPGAQGGFMVFYETVDMAVSAFEELNGRCKTKFAPLMVMVKLAIRSDLLHEYLNCVDVKEYENKHSMNSNSGLRISKSITFGFHDGVTLEKYGDVTLPHAPCLSSPEILPASPVLPGMGKKTLYAGFLKEYAGDLKSRLGLHWTVQPGGFGRATMYQSARDWKDQKYNVYQRSFIGEGPELCYVEVNLTEYGYTLLLQKGWLEHARSLHGRAYDCFYFYGSIFSSMVNSEDQDKLVYTARFIKS